jgi:hypothetical protein
MQAPIEIRYAGVIVGRAQEVRSAEGEAAFFLPGKEPMPVGTVVRLRSGKGETPARVIRAVESPDPAMCGMQVRLIGEEEEVAPDWIPAPLPAKPKPSPPAPVAVQPPTPTPTVPVDVAAMQAEAAKLPAEAAPESAAVPEAVPVAVGSSLTGALAKAATSSDAPASDDLDILITDTPPPVVIEAAAPVAVPAAPDPDATPPPPVPAASPPAAVTQDETSEAASGESPEENGDNAAAGDNGRITEEMPTARAISGSSTRRKTKRRRYPHE